MSIQWTSAERLAALMRLPWSIRVETDPHDGGLIARVTEVPDAIATGATERELAKDLWDALYLSLKVRLEHDDWIPLPAGQELPWASQNAPKAPTPTLFVRWGSADPVRTASASLAPA